MSSTVSIPLTELLLRPSTLQRFTRRGFESTDEIEESRANGGINLLASELDVSLQEAAGLIREVQGCLGSYAQSEAIRNDRNIGVDRISGKTSTSSGAVANEGNTSSIDCNSNESGDDNHQKQTAQNCDDGIVTAYELLQMDDDYRVGKKRNRRHIVTFCRSVDDLLGGGIALGQVTEIAGLPGTGKTQLATQLSVLARLPHIYGGVEGRTLYVDAEGSFMAERAFSMAKALYNHVQGRRKTKRDRNRKSSGDSGSNLPSDFTIEGILDSIDVFRVYDETALLATLYSLRNYIESSVSSPKSTLPVKLIIIDSIAFHFRAVIPDNKNSYYVQRTKTLTALAAYLGDLANQHDLAVVVINQMTTKMSNNYKSGNNTVSIVPALGESWAHATATRLILSKEGVQDQRVARSDGNESEDDQGSHHFRQQIQQELRTCSLTKSAHRPTGKARYQILEDGIRDVPGEYERIRVASSNGNNKRSRLN